MRSVRNSALALFTLLGLGACSSDGGNGPSTNSLSDAQAWVIGDQVATQLGEMSAALIHFDLSGTGVVTASPAPGAVVGRVLAGVLADAPSAEHRRAYSALLTSVPCTPVMTSTADSDGDGMPEDLLYTWGCSITDSASGNGFAISGKVRVRDMVDVSTGFGYRVDFDGFSFINTYQHGVNTDISRWDGSIFHDVTGSRGEVRQDKVYQFHRNGQRLLYTAWDLTLAFTPSTTIDWVGHDLPAGTFAVTGDYSHIGDTGGNGSGDWTFKVKSLGVLGYNGACTVAPPFYSGLVKGELVGRTDVGFGVSFAGCGNYAVSPLAPEN